MKQPKWLERLYDLGDRLAGIGASKHARGTTRPRNWRRDKRAERKRRKLARRAQRGKR